MMLGELFATDMHIAKPFLQIQPNSFPALSFTCPKEKPMLQALYADTLDFSAAFFIEEPASCRRFIIDCLAVASRVTTKSHAVTRRFLMLQHLYPYKKRFISQSY